MSTRAPTSSGPEIREEPRGGDVPLLVHPGWSERFPWLVQGVTARGGEGGFDLALFGARGGGRGAWERWLRLMEALDARTAVHGRQVHGSRIAFHRELPPGLFLREGVDGHATASPGVVLTVALADCVPVFLVATEPRAVALLHAGWRGVAAGVVEAGVARLRDQLGIEPRELHLHAGPSICGECYEVGPEVHRALGLPEPDAPRPVDLRSRILERARDVGIDPARSSRSGHCTRCGGADLYSHRGGDTGRHVAFLAIRSTGGAG